MARMILAAMLALAVGCGSTSRGSVRPTTASHSVVVRKAEPSPVCEELGPISVEDGNGCGLVGSRGNHERAYQKLRNAAASRGADFVRMDVVVEPHLVGGCFDNRYVIRGIAFRCASTSAPARERSCLEYEEFEDRLEVLDEMRSRGGLTEAGYQRLRDETKSQRCEAEANGTTERDETAPTSEADQPSDDVPSAAEAAEEDRAIEEEDAGEGAREQPVADDGEEGRTSHEARLRRLQRLHEQGLITDEEYEAKKTEILDEL